MEIIVIEDDQSIRENLKEILEVYNYTVRPYADGLQGLAGIQEHAPDLVICDIMTPQMDGFEVLKTLKSKARTANIPFIFLTAKIERADQRKGMEMGADDYIVKPFTTQELINAIDTRLQKQKHTETKIQDELFNKLNAFAKINSHEYNTPLNGIIGLTSTLNDSIDQLSKSEITNIAKAIKSSAKRLHRTFKNFILYILLQRGELNSPKSVINHNWLETFVKDLLTTKSFKFNRLEDVRLVSHKGPFSIALATDDLSYIIEELIWNALKFSAVKTEIKVEITSNSKGFEISVSNHTKDSSFFENAEAFKQFGREMHEQQGSGLGLYLSKKIAEIYGWQLSQKYHLGQSAILLKVSN